MSFRGIRAFEPQVSDMRDKEFQDLACRTYFAGAFCVEAFGLGAVVCLAMTKLAILF